MKDPSSSRLLVDVRTMVDKYPDRVALIFPCGSDGNRNVLFEKATFQHLDEESNRLAHGLSEFGLRQGMRVLFLVRPGIHFITSAFALLKIGAVPVFIDPGMGRQDLLRCIHEVEPDAMVADPVVHILRIVSGKFFRSVRYSITVGRRWFWGGAALGDLRSENHTPFPSVPAGKDDVFMIGFTTGSTGRAKGVVFTYENVEAQIRTIRDCMEFHEGDIVLQGFPPFALRDVAMGLTCVLPEMDPTKPAEVDPLKVISAIREHGVTHSFGSPAFWGRVGQYCVRHEITLPSLRRIMLAGAPVSPRIVIELKSTLSESAEVYTPYGATEALPLTSITGSEIVEGTAHLTDQGAGTCVGRPLPGIGLKIVKITDGPIADWDETLVLQAYEIGEIVATGAVVTKAYFRRPVESALSKICNGKTVWHRMGDVGYLDNDNRLWFCGRKDHRVATKDGTLFTVPCESIFNRLRDVGRSALVGVGPKGEQTPVIVIQPLAGRMPRTARVRERFVDELLALGAQYEQTRMIRKVLFHPDFPVDFRHNAKIKREELARWAEGRI